MAFIKKIKDGNTEIEIYDLDLSDDEIRANLNSLYKTINQIADNQRQQGRNVDNWFLAAEELEKRKQSGLYKFI